MKNLNIACYLGCCFLVSILFSCEKAEIQKSIPNDTAKIETRGDDCTNCPPEDCCCLVTLTEGTSAPLVFCGTTNPELSTSECEAVVTGCNEIQGYYWFTTLTSSPDPTEHFCVEKNTGFMIGILTGSASLRVTCQVGQLAPQTVNVTVTSPNKVFFNVNDDCELEVCP